MGYSYRVPDALANSAMRSGDASRAELTRALTQPSEYDPITPPVFATPARVPAMTWKTQPTTGHVGGTVKTSGGTPFDQVRVDLYDAETDVLIGSRLTDGMGWYGFVDLAPGRYKVQVDPARVHGRGVEVFTVVAGQVARADVTPQPAGAEGRRPVKAEHGFDPQEPDVEPNGTR